MVKDNYYFLKIYYKHLSCYYTKWLDSSFLMDFFSFVNNQTMKKKQQKKKEQPDLHKAVDNNMIMDDVIFLYLGGH